MVVKVCLRIVCLGLRCVCSFPMVKGSSSVGLKVMFPRDRWPRLIVSCISALLCPDLRSSAPNELDFVHLLLSSLSCVLKSSCL